MTQNKARSLPIIATAFIVLFGMAYSMRAKADISNILTTPKNNSITNAMLQSGIILDTNVAANSAIQLSKTGTAADSQDIPFGGASGLATSSNLKFNSGINTFSSLGSTTLGATTTINTVQYIWPTAQGAVSTSIQNDGSGNLSWGTSGSTVTTQNFATTTANKPLYALPISVVAGDVVMWWTIDHGPAGACTSSSQFQLVADIKQSTMAATSTITTADLTGLSTSQPCSISAQGYYKATTTESVTVSAININATNDQLNLMVQKIH